ncbi:Actin-depolymerizing factor 5 [Hibiscus syriacus]|uniref:Actin-depolymerizing factor 5 n=1 Tax=Hibiscus syriacus TaxID=106335 RepID=A0A6A2YPH0_HIBSY|nr:Actin-depolymerizing factor 5 [Hibiscus syriacus]
MASKVATTGMWVTDECKKSFMEMKWIRYIVFKIGEKSRMVTVDKVGGSSKSYDDLTALLPIDDCRYAVFDFDFVTVDKCLKSKLFFVARPQEDRHQANLSALIAFVMKSPMLPLMQDALTVTNPKDILLIVLNLLQ